MPLVPCTVPVDLLLLRWVNFHMREAKYSKVVENFSSDLVDSEELMVILAACSKAKSSPTVIKSSLKNVDIEATFSRSENVAYAKMYMNYCFKI